MIPVEKRVEGAAVFWGTNASKISHVAYLDEPVTPGKPEGDWYIIEARGVLYGVVRTKLYEREPNFWGWMTKYYDYDSTPAATPDTSTLGSRTLQKGDRGEDVRQLQEKLKDLGYSLEVDGIFGSDTQKKVKEFQKANGLTANGVFDAAALEKLNNPKAKADYVVTGGSVYTYTNHPSYGGKKTTIVKKGQSLEEPDFGNYIPVIHNGILVWINEKYVSKS
jgi:hypothetical protein